MSAGRRVGGFTAGVAGYGLRLFLLDERRQGRACLAAVRRRARVAAQGVPRQRGQRKQTTLRNRSVLVQGAASKRCEQLFCGRHSAAAAGARLRFFCTSGLAV